MIMRGFPLLSSALLLSMSCASTKVGDSGSSLTTTTSSTTTTTSSSTTTTTTTTSSSTTTTTTTSGVPSVLTCPIADPCGTVNLTMAWSGVDFPADVRCLFQALAQADAGDSEGLAFGTGLSGDSPSRTHLQLDGVSRSVLKQDEGYLNGSGAWVDPVQDCTLAPSSYFQDCLDTPQVSCGTATNWYSGCVDNLQPVCPT